MRCSGRLPQRRNGAPGHQRYCIQKIEKTSAIVYDYGAMPTPLLFSPELRILPAPQRRLWGELSAVPAAFTLYGGTAIALHLGHRESIDFDFFGNAPFDPDRLLKSLGFLSSSEIIQREKDALTVRIDRDGPVLVSFFAVPHLGRVEAPVVSPDNNLKIASLIDLAGMKADVVQKRAEAKDYVDIDALLTAGIGLPLALSAARAIQGPRFNPQITLKALSYFGDGSLKTLPGEVRRRLQAAVRDVDIETLPAILPLKACAGD
jgi:Nucleotidyl transferase AbiEii toxin, Type IV TA system